MEIRRAPKKDGRMPTMGFGISKKPVGADGSARLGQRLKRRAQTASKAGGREADRAKEVPPLDAPPRQAERLPPFGGVPLGVLRLAVGDPVAAFDDGRVRA